MKYSSALILALLAAAPLSAAQRVSGEADAPYDIVVYGGTSSGIAAAVQASRMGKSVVVIEPTDRIGGLTTGGLGQTDIGNKHVIGGISREFYQVVRKHYADPAAWKWQTHEEYRLWPHSNNRLDEDTMWTFEPSVALAIFERWLRDLDIPVLCGERLDLNRDVQFDSGRILCITLESGRRIYGKMFIDATYEGDLMAKAGVSYAVGREANATYGETLNGVQTQQAKKHQFKPGVDPYRRKGDPTSGLLPGIAPTGPIDEGQADHRVQAYCFRMCLTNNPKNRIPFQRPAGFNELDYELLFRNFEAGENRTPWINSRMPNAKTDTNNRHAVSTDFIGQNYEYPEADYARREEIAARHRHYQQGLMWVLANHPRVPEDVRTKISEWGLCRDEFFETDGWPSQLYIREARRMIGPYVMTQHNCQGRETASDSIGMGAYGMDSHNVQRYVEDAGYVRNEGDVQVWDFPPYPISYRSITPKESECRNLLVPVCLSASHIAFGSIRMEPVFMILGQSAATAAAIAIEQDVSVQDVPYPDLRSRLRRDRQILQLSDAAHDGTPD